MARSYSAAVLLLVLLAVALQPTAAANSRRPSNPDTTAFGRRAWLHNLTLLGSASLLPGQFAVALTTNASDGIGAGRALLSEPVRLLLQRAAPASFSTRFTFRIAPSPRYGDGLAFILTSSHTFLGAANGYMGLYAAAPASTAGDIANVSTLAVEMDTHQDVALGDPDGNHIALDAGSIFSAASASPGVDLKAGKPVTAWIEYQGQRRRLRAWVSYSSSRRHLNPALDITLDLAKLVKETMFVGFSASNRQGGAAVHVVEAWSFRTFWDQSTQQGPPPPPLFPVLTLSPPSPVALLPHHHHRYRNIMAGVVAGSLFLIIIIVCGLWCRRSSKNNKFIQLADMQRILPHGARSC